MSPMHQVYLYRRAIIGKNDVIHLLPITLCYNTNMDNNGPSKRSLEDMHVMGTTALIGKSCIVL